MACSHAQQWRVVFTFQSSFCEPFQVFVLPPRLQALQQVHISVVSHLSQEHSVHCTMSAEQKWDQAKAEGAAAVKDAKDAASIKAGELKDAAKDTAYSASDSARNAASSASDKASSAADDAKSSGASYLEQAKDAVSHAAQSVKETVSNAAQGAKDTMTHMATAHAGDRTSNLDEQLIDTSSPDASDIQTEVPPHRQHL